MSSGPEDNYGWTIEALEEADYEYWEQRELDDMMPFSNEE